MIFLPNVMTNIRFVCFLCNKMPKFSLLFRRVFSVYALIHAAIRVATVEYMMMKKLILINNFLFLCLYSSSPSIKSSIWSIISLSSRWLRRYTTPPITPPITPPTAPDMSIA